MQTIQDMHSIRFVHHHENGLFTSKTIDLRRVLIMGQTERQLAKLNVAGSIPVSRSR